MKIYTLYIDDDRYRVPTLLSVELMDDTQASAHIARLFTRSEHYRAIEVWEEERQVEHCLRPPPGQAFAEGP